jgi:class 3 adenylate cyclase
LPAPRGASTTSPELLRSVRRARERLLGGDQLVDVNVAARLCDAARPDEVLASDRALLKLDPVAVTSKNRRFRAKGVPKEIAVYSLSRVG